MNVYILSNLPTIAYLLLNSVEYDNWGLDDTGRRVSFSYYESKIDSAKKLKLTYQTGTALVDPKQFSETLDRLRAIVRLTQESRKVLADAAPQAAQR